MAIAEATRGMAFGTGVDSLSGEIRGDAIIRTAPEEISGGQTVDLTLTLVRRQEELNSAIQLSTEVSASYMMFGGSAKFGFSENLNFQTNSVWLIIYVSVQNAFRQMRDLQLKQEALDLLRNGQEPRFREQFGDVFVRGIQFGGELAVVLQIETESTEHSSKVTAELQAGGILGAGAVSTSDSFNSTFRRATQNSRVILRHHQRGGEQNASINTDTMIEHALGFAKSVKADNGANSVPFAVLLQDYKSLALPVAPNWVQIENAKIVLQSVFGRRSQALARLNLVNYVIDHPEQFVNSGDLNPVANRLAVAITALTNAASQCVNSVKDCAIPQVDIPMEPLPQRITTNIRIPVPNVLGLPNDDAISTIKAVGLEATFELEFITDEAHDGRIIKQEPVANLPVEKGSIITVTGGMLKKFPHFPH